MKRFKTISTTFIIVIAVIFGCNVFYLVNLYNSIRANVERDVMTALADADIDELWIRAERATRAPQSDFDLNSDSEKSRHGEVSVGQSKGVMVTSTRYADGRSENKKQKIETGKDGHSLTNKLINELGKQFHVVMDAYVPVNLSVMDSVITVRLNERFIFPDYVSVVVVNSNGDITQSNPGYQKVNYDEFTYCANSDLDMYYRAYITPLTGHIISQMSGVIITVFLLLVAFTLAFWYLFHTVSRLRTIEEMKDDFVSNMTHELKTPIAIAYSANDALLNYDTTNDPEKKETYLNIANKQLKRLGELVENILAMSMERRKTMKLKPETIRLQPFIDEIAAAQRMRGEKKITIVADVDENASIEADRTHLANILNNLIDNAIKYSGESVDITIVGNEKGISVADNGIGIPAKSIPYLFNKFYRVPHGNLQDVRGYGIGLYYVQSIIDKMGWTISVRSKESEGSVFNIKFNGDEK